MSNKLIIVEIKRSDVEKREGKDKNGKDYVVHTQGAWLWNGDDFPLQFPLSLEVVEQNGAKSSTPYAPGRYLLAEGALRKPAKDEYNFAVARYVKLVSVEEALAQLGGKAERFDRASLSDRGSLPAPTAPAKVA